MTVSGNHSERGKSGRRGPGDLLVAALGKNGQPTSAGVDLPVLGEEEGFDKQLEHFDCRLVTPPILSTHLCRCISHFH